MLLRELLYTLLGTGFTCLATVMGAAMVFFFRKDMSSNTQKVFLGFAAGVMTAAAVWSLLIPAMDMARDAGQSPIPVSYTHLDVYKRQERGYPQTLLLSLRESPR